MPKVSVLMSAFNASAYIKQAVDSVLAQTFTDFELIILNDGSTDSTKEIIHSYTDFRIVYLENEGNQGLAFTRNRLIAEANGEFLAWLDSDDVALPTRLAEEVAFLEKNPTYALVASWAKIIDEHSHPNGNFIKSYIPNQHLSPLFLFVNYLVQSSVMMRKNLLPSTHYDLRFPPTEDYEFWVRISYQHPIAILPKVLVEYRQHSTNISHTQSQRAKQTVQLNHQHQLAKLGIVSTPSQIDLHYQIGFGHSSEITIEFLEKAEKWLQTIEDANQKSRIYNADSLHYILSHRWLKLCTANKKLGFRAIKTYFSSKFATYNLYHLALLGRFLIKVIQ